MSHALRKVTMDSHPHRRRRLIPLLGVLAGALLIVPAVVVYNAPTNAPANAAVTASYTESVDQHHGHVDARALNQKQVVFHDQMRKLWEDHVTWTKLAIVTFADGSAGFDATAARLLQNQTDIGDAIKPFYGAAPGNRLTALLHDHITIAVELLQDAKPATRRPSTRPTPAGTPTPTTSRTSCPRPTRASGRRRRCGPR